MKNNEITYGLPVMTTEVLAESGWISLDRIEVGEKIAAFNKESNLFVFEEVLTKMEPYQTRTYTMGNLEAAPNQEILTYDDNLNIIASSFTNMIFSMSSHSMASMSDSKDLIRRVFNNSVLVHNLDVPVSCVTVPSGFIVIKQNDIITIVGDHISNEPNINAIKSTTSFDCKNINDDETITNGSTVRLDEYAISYDGQPIPAYLKIETWVVESIQDDLAILIKNAIGFEGITLRVNKKYLNKVILNGPSPSALSAMRLGQKQ